MKAQDDLRTIAKFTSAIVSGTGDAGAKMSNYKHDVTAHELGGNAVRSTTDAYKSVEDICNAAKAQMIRACAGMLAEVESLDASARKATAKLNDASGRVAQSLAKTKEVMGPGVEDRLKQLERFVDCMERLRNLHDDGVVERVAKSLSGR